MKQIKTIREQNPDKFDERVNKALAEGWYIVRRLANHEGFIAELETVVITEKERGCENCKYGDTDACLSPCCDCEDGMDGYPTEWEAVEK